MRLANSNTCGIIMLRIRCNLLFLIIACLIFVQACSLGSPTVSVEEIASKTGKLIAEVEYGLEYDDVVPGKSIDSRNKQNRLLFPGEPGSL
jgi:hypothetical protein